MMKDLFEKLKAIAGDFTEHCDLRIYGDGCGELYKNNRLILDFASLEELAAKLAEYSVKEKV